MPEPTAPHSGGAPDNAPGPNDTRLADSGSTPTARASRREFDLSCYLVTDPGMSAQSVPEVVREAVAGGVTFVQVRDKDASDEEFTAVAREVVEALRGTGVPVVLDDRVHLVRATGADGVHVGQSDMPPAQVRELVGENAIVGLSVGTPAELDAALADPATAAAIDYLGVGPVKNTDTKADHDPAIGFDGLALVARRSPWPTCAIGGVKAADARAVHEAGSDGLCVVSAIMAAPDPRAAAQELADAWASAR